MYAYGYGLFPRITYLSEITWSLKQQNTCNKYLIQFIQVSAVKVEENDIMLILYGYICGWDIFFYYFLSWKVIAKQTSLLVLIGTCNHGNMSLWKHLLLKYISTKISTVLNPQKWFPWKLSQWKHFLRKKVLINNFPLVIDFLSISSFAGI